MPLQCYSPAVRVQGVYSVEALDALLAEERGLVAEMERDQHSSHLVTKDTEEVD